MIINFTILIYFPIYIDMHYKEFGFKEESINESRILYFSCVLYFEIYLYSYINFEVLLKGFVTKKSLI